MGLFSQTNTQVSNSARVLTLLPPYHSRYQAADAFVLPAPWEGQEWLLYAPVRKEASISFGCVVALDVLMTLPVSFLARKAQLQSHLGCTRNQTYDHR